MLIDVHTKTPIFTVK